MRPTSLPVWKLKNADQAAILRTVTQPVSLEAIPTPAMQELIAQMIKTMYQAEGIGLAAPQIGQSIRLAVIAREVQGLAEPLVLFNPSVTDMSTQQVSLEEGCLSIPKVFGPVARSWSLKLTALDRQAQTYTIMAEDLLARVIQHEVDHLNGMLFIDRASTITDGQHLF